MRPWACFARFVLSLSRYWNKSAIPAANGRKKGGPKPNSRGRLTVHAPRAGVNVVSVCYCPGSRPCWLPAPKALLDDLGHDAGADRAAALANREPETRVHGDRLDQLDLH